MMIIFMGVKNLGNQMFSSRLIHTIGLISSDTILIFISIENRNQLQIQSDHVPSVSIQWTRCSLGFSEFSPNHLSKVFGSNGDDGKEIVSSSFLSKSEH